MCGTKGGIRGYRPLPFTERVPAKEDLRYHLFVVGRSGTCYREGGMKGVTGTGSAGVKAVCVIPARYHSLRFPAKVLSYLGDKPLLEWVWLAAGRCSGFAEIVFAIDHPKTATLIDGFGGRYVMTRRECRSGTDRLIEVMGSGLLQGDVWVNWQGDEPFITPRMIDDLLRDSLGADIGVVTLKKRIESKEEVADPNVVKVVTDSMRRALYFSRFPVPYRRGSEGGDAVRYKHIGLYAYKRETLAKIATLPTSPLAEAEQLEQLRFLEHGITVEVRETREESQSIDTKEDLLDALKKISSLPAEAN
ncbi:MAG: 3-deoxy-manno-octulosonate cytidylyltransferase [Simkaniaceae bacterium]|nr:3-deoxy-manno-octulosonate cytidylyltransferase [Simkaniaceae bacterium]